MSIALIFLHYNYPANILVTLKFGALVENVSDVR